MASTYSVNEGLKCYGPISQIYRREMEIVQSFILIKSLALDLTYIQ